jgi:hypothetical protein
LSGKGRIGNSHKSVRAADANKFVKSVILRTGNTAEEDYGNSCGCSVLDTGKFVSSRSMGFRRLPLKTLWKAWATRGLGMFQ